MIFEVYEVDVWESFAGPYVSLELENPAIRTMHKPSLQRVKCHTIAIENQARNGEKVDNPVLDQPHVEHVQNEPLLSIIHDPCIALVSKRHTDLLDL